MLSPKHNVAIPNYLETVTFSQFCEIAHVKHSRGYEILNSGVVKSVLVGGSRLVLIQTWYDYLKRLLEEQQTFTPGRHPTRYQPSVDATDADASPPPRRRGRPPKFRPNTVADPAP